MSFSEGVSLFPLPSFYYFSFNSVSSIGHPLLVESKLALNFLRVSFQDVLWIFYRLLIRQHQMLAILG